MEMAKNCPEKNPRTGIVNRKRNSKTLTSDSSPTTPQGGALPWCFPDFSAVSEITLFVKIESQFLSLVIPTTLDELFGDREWIVAHVHSPCATGAARPSAPDRS